MFSIGFIRFWQSAPSKTILKIKENHYPSQNFHPNLENYMILLFFCISSLFAFFASFPSHPRPQLAQTLHPAGYGKAGRERRGGEAGGLGKGGKRLENAKKYENNCFFNVLLIIMLRIMVFLWFYNVFDGADCQNLIKPKENNYFLYNY